MKTRMNNLFKAGIVVIASLCSLTINAQTKQIENSLLWEVSGNGLTKPSYLFGTVHMICEKDFVLRPTVKEAFSKTDKLALEVNLSDPDEMAYMQKLAMGTELLSKKLSAAQLAELENILQKQAGLSVKQVDSYTLATVMSLLFVKSFGCENLKFYEMEFVAKATEDKKEIIGLETGQAQMEFFGKSYSDEQMMDYFKFITTEETQKLVQNYVREDLSGLYQEVINEKVMDANAKKWMLDVRNANWINKMPALMQKQSIFFAVGAAHLAGEQGLINLLKKAGYTIKPVMNL